MTYEDIEAKVATVIPGDQPQHTGIHMAIADHPGIAVPIPATVTPGTVTVPNFLGDNLDDVEKVIGEIRLTVGRIDQDNRCIDVKGTVLEQDPIGEARVPRGTPVNLLVSSGLDANGDPCVFK